MFTLPDLPFSFSALEPHIDAATMQLHHDKHHATYVNNLNASLADYPDLLNQPIDQLLRNLSDIPQKVRTRVQNHGGGHSNHSLFWTFMSPAASQPDARLLDLINSAFVSLDDFKRRFTDAALNRFGSGWVWLVTSGQDLQIIDTPNQDSPLIQGLTPILGLDVWEHAYYLKYQNRRADYIAAWWNVVNWSQVSKLIG